MLNEKQKEILKNLATIIPELSDKSQEKLGWVIDEMILVTKPQTTKQKYRNLGG